MGSNILKNLSVSFLFLFTIGCEDTRMDHPGNFDDSYGTVYVSVDSIPEIVINESSWQTLKTIWGELTSDIDVTYTRVEWDSDMFWVINDTTGYFKANCKKCTVGLWYDNDGTTQAMEYDFHTMAPVTNQVSIVNDESKFGNVLAPVKAMRGDKMWLWWSIAGVYTDSMQIELN